jgi:hypothetical protein
MQRLGIGLMLVSGLMACGKSEDEKKTSSDTLTEGNGKLSASDLTKPTTLGEMSKFDAEMFMLINSSSFLATEAEVEEETEEPQTDDETNLECMNFMDSLVFKAAGDTAILDYSVNLTSCLQAVYQEEISEATISLSHALASFYIQQTCTGQDLSSLDGKKLSEVEEPQCDNSLITFNTKMDVAGVIEFQGQSVDLTSISIGSTSTANNEPCTITRSGTTSTMADGCQEIQISISGDGADNEYVRFAGKGLTWVDSTANTWYGTGSFDLELNDWTGALTYSAGAAPQYSLSRGTETLTGSLNLPVALHAKNAWKRTLLRGIKLK